MRVLVVDDEKLLVKGIKFNLENEGYEVETAYDGVEAVEKVRNQNIDLVIMDLKTGQKGDFLNFIGTNLHSDTPYEKVRKNIKLQIYIIPSFTAIENKHQPGSVCFFQPFGEFFFVYDAGT